MTRRLLGDRRMTNAELQARRRDLFNRMRDTLRAISEVRTAKEARAMADAMLRQVPGGKPPT